MPGENCAILGCGSRRRTKGIGIWKSPAPKDEAHKKWLQRITRSRDMDRHFKELLAKHRVFTCEKHFEPEDIEIFHSKKMTKKRPRFGAIPKRATRHRSRNQELDKVVSLLSKKRNKPINIATKVCLTFRRDLKGSNL
ncbi:uncharacterized protein LOC122949872 [Acropora millepora]|uniref:uncharacterized protein LOC122949872 n=1 Tax=Acropora millepora TaxID=45264 RepID=UPI001CF1FC4F|nr:uncharacterized protein LOC122949872 [Acropora millepora]